MTVDSRCEIFQSFLRMRDSEVERLLKCHPRSPKYVRRGAGIHKVLARTKYGVFLSNDSVHSIQTAMDYIYTFDDYINDKHQYKRHFFKNIGSSATLDYIKRRAEFYYGEENVWVDMDSPSVIIKFPEVAIKNSVDDCHVMKDIFIKMNVRNGMFSGIEMARTTVNEDEYGRYLFSHLNSGMPGLYNSALCFGSTDLGVWIAESRLNNNFTFIDKIIASLAGYLSWESLEGRPYKYMEIIRKPNVDLRGSSYYKLYEELPIALNLIYNSDIKLRYKISDESNHEQKLKISNIDDIDEVLKNEELQQYYRYRNDSYTEICRRKIPSEIFSEVVFKGENVPVVVEPSNHLIGVEKRCHRRLLDLVVSELQDQLLKFIKENQ